MAQISQRLQFNGGVTQQPDTLVLANQVRSCVNGYNDLTFGTLKRSGAQFLSQLRDEGGDIIPAGALDDGKWFSIFRDRVEKYVGIILGEEIFMWDLTDGSRVTVNYIGDAQSYLTGTSPEDYHVMTVNDYTVITNKTVTVAELPEPGAWRQRDAFVTVKALAYNSSYTITSDGSVARSYTLNTFVDPTAGRLDITTVCDDLGNGINTGNVDINQNVTIGNGFYLGGNGADFKISVSGGVTDSIEVFQQTVSDISKLPNLCYNGYVVKVANSGIDEDDYYVRFETDSGEFEGPGLWRETRSPEDSPGLDASTLPHRLIRRPDGQFDFSVIPYEERLVGDDVTNPHPSFVGKTIRSTFFFQDRFGMLTKDNVILSQSNDYVNFYAQSALTSLPTDPIDISVPSTRPASLYYARPVTQGLLLFSSGGVFQMTSGSDSRATPSNIQVRNLLRQDNSLDIDPVDLGTTLAFAGSAANFTKVFEMETLGSEENPIVNDLTKILPEWIRIDVDNMAASTQYSTLFLSSRLSRTVYVFNFYTEGERRLNQSWVEWEMSGNVQYVASQDELGMVRH
jgi:hypothetical protein